MGDICPNQKHTHKTVIPNCPKRLFMYRVRNKYLLHTANCRKLRSVFLLALRQSSHVNPAKRLKFFLLFRTIGPWKFSKRTSRITMANHHKKIRDEKRRDVDNKRQILYLIWSSATDAFWCPFERFRIALRDTFVCCFRFNKFVVSILDTCICGVETSFN